MLSALYPTTNMIITILAKKRGSIPAEDSIRPHLSVAYHDVPIVPRVGQEVHIFDLTSCGGLFAEDPEGRPPRYVAHDSNILGRVVGIRAMEKRMSEFAVVRSESESSKNAYGWLPCGPAHARQDSH